MKSIKDISLPITEEEYRKRDELSYSLLAKYERGGFNSLSTLFDRVESPSLTLGSAVDSIITGGQEEFDERFIVAEFPNIPDSIITIVKELHKLHSGTSRSIKDIPDSNIISLTEVYKYQLNWKPETRAKVIKEKGEEYYTLLYLSEGKTILDTETYNIVCSMVSALKDSEATKWYFQPDNPFENIERVYQAKFAAEFAGVEFRCMADLILVDYDNKIVYPVDLKTSYKNEYDFYRSFLEWRYDIQARLYWRIIRANMDSDEFFKDFKLADYKFIVVSRGCKPLVWNCDFTQSLGALRFGKNNQIEMRDPLEIGIELKEYLDTNAIIPNGINESGTNDLRTWLNKI